MNFAKENIMLKARIKELESALAICPYICCTRWTKLVFMALRKIGFGQNKIDNFMKVFDDLCTMANENDTWEDEVDYNLNKSINMPFINVENVIKAGIKK